MRLTKKHAARAKRPMIRHNGFILLITPESKHKEWLISIPLKKSAIWNVFHLFVYDLVQE